MNELEEYFKVPLTTTGPREDFNSCDPLKWWISCPSRGQFLNVYRLACDVLSIPGECFLFFSFLFL